MQNKKNETGLPNRTQSVNVKLNQPSQDSILDDHNRVFEVNSEGRSQENSDSEGDDSSQMDSRNSSSQNAKTTNRKS